MSAPEIDMNSRIDAWKKKLLDLGKRNRLLNYKDTKRGSLRIVEPELADLWSSFVEKEMPLSFPYIEENDDPDAEETTYKSGDLKTNKEVSDQQKILRNLRSKARTSIQEQGINTLYLAFGFLRWREAQQSEQYLESPLILVPVSLYWESITSPFKIMLHDDEIVLNPTLEYKMENDFGIAFPAFSSDDDPMSYFDAIETLVSAQGWSVSREVALSLMSFLKINMYSDLERHRESIAANPVARALGGDPSGLENDLSAYDSYDHDASVKPEDCFSVVDADASQMDAILCAKSGGSFVLQGPPGTGKSQTITNIIAELLADGKKVLFVSEKMAALDVVHRRLRECGLEDFCLVLHSHKANKKEVLGQLGSSLELSEKTIRLREEAYQSLDRLFEDRSALNRYVSELHQVIEPLGMSVFEANGELARFADSEDLIFDIPNISTTSRGDYRKLIGVVRRYRDVIAEMGEDITANPWFGASVSFLGNELRHNILAKQREADEALDKLDKILEAVCREYGVSSSRNLAQARGLVELISFIQSGHLIPEKWLKREDLSVLFASVERGRATQEAQQALLSELVPSARSLGLLADEEKIGASDRHRLLEVGERAKTSISSLDYFKEWNRVDELNRVQELVSDAKMHALTIKKMKESIERSFSLSVYEVEYLPIKRRFEQLYDTGFLEVYSHYIEDRAAINSLLSAPCNDYSPADMLALLDKVQRLEVLRDWKDSSPEIAEHANLTSVIETLYEPEINEIQYDEIYLRFKAKMGSFGKMFNSQYRSDKSLIGSLRRNSQEKIEDQEVIGILSKLRRRDELKRWIDQSPEIKELLELEDAVSKVFSAKVFESDYNGLHGRFETLYTAEFCEKADNYRHDMEALSGFWIGPDGIDHANALKVLNHLSTWSDDEGWFSAKESDLRLALASAYQRENTDFGHVENELARFAELKKCLDLSHSAIETIDRVEANRATEADRFDFLYKGLETDWNDIADGLELASKLREKLMSLGISPTSDFARKVCIEENFSISCLKAQSEIKDSLQKVEPLAEWFSSLFEDPEGILESSLLSIRDRFYKCSNNVSALEEWLDYRSICDECETMGLALFVRETTNRRINSSDLEGIFVKRFFRLWLDSVLPSMPSLANFRGHSHEALIREFRKLDKRQADIARSRVRARIVNALPSLDRFTDGADEVHILRREMGKKRRIMPIRKLFRAIPNLVMTLKPCLMMSPLSVSLFLEANTFDFDTVIFDEASQVCTENAIGAIFRGKQVIIAGDSRQLPPTNFFMANSIEGDFDADSYEDETETFSFESVLDEAALLPERTLLWHYRSRHEHLIAFSNAKIYRNRLITFPSTVEKAPDMGVEYVYVADGFYDRGGRHGNVPEAERVASLVFEHFKKYPERSLGVIAFGEIQELAIDAAIRKMRLESQEFESFFDEDRDEPFFVKSLENVQGDERDTIIFSIGYARDANGIMRMQFGPLSQSGGERRLNVAITRAKINIKLVGSIMPTDIATERISSDGPKLLRGYIEFAMRGPEVLEQEIETECGIIHDSPFEESVFDFLTSRHYKVATQVGCSGFRIDMAVRHPELDGRFVLGIECDGATYHSTRTARERDRLRQDVLEGMGWNIYRIWSTDWIKDPVTEKKKLADAVDRAISEYVEDLPIPNNEAHLDASDSNEPNFIEVTEVSNVDADNPYGFFDRREPDFSSLPYDASGYVSITSCISEIIDCTYPTHCEIVYQYIAPLMGYDRAGSKVKRAVDSAVMRMDDIVRNGDFFYPKEHDGIRAYGSCGRPIKHISNEELACAMEMVASRCIGATKESLIEETARAYGYNRLGSRILSAMEEAFSSLLNKGAIEEVGGKVRVALG